MSMVMLRTGGRRFDVDAFLERFPKVDPDVVWHRGDAGRRGHVTAKTAST